MGWLLAVCLLAGILPQLSRHLMTIGLQLEGGSGGPCEVASEPRPAPICSMACACNHRRARCIWCTGSAVVVYMRASELITLQQSQSLNDKTVCTAHHQHREGMMPKSLAETGHRVQSL